MPSHRPSPLPLWHRLGAVGLAALVLMLTLLAASPSAHHWLHEDEAHAAHVPTAEHEEGCVVVLFGTGVTLALVPELLSPPAGHDRAEPSWPRVEVDLVSPRYLRQPERGPPAA